MTFQTQRLTVGARATLSNHLFGSRFATRTFELSSNLQTVAFVRASTSLLLQISGIYKR